MGEFNKFKGKRLLYDEDEVEYDSDLEVFDHKIQDDHSGALVVKDQKRVEAVDENADLTENVEQISVDQLARITVESVKYIRDNLRRKDSTIYHLTYTKPK